MTISFKSLVLYFCAAALAVASLFILAAPAHAQGVPIAIATNGMGQTVFYPANATPPTGYTRGQSVWNSAMDTDGGHPRATAATAFRTPSGISVPSTATTRVPPAEVGKAVGRFATKVIYPIAFASALYDVAIELGFRPGGTAQVPTMEKTNSVSCSVAPCFGYTHIGSGIIFSSPMAACSDHAARFRAANFGWTTSGISATTTQCSYSEITPTGVVASTGLRAFLNQSSVAPVPAVYSPSTTQAFIDAVAARSGWPAGSRISEILSHPFAEPALIIPSAVIASGPSTSTGTRSVTTNTTNNTTTTNQTTNNHAYQGAVVTTTVTNTSVTVNNGTGVTTNNETSTVTAPSAPPPEPAVTCGLPGSPACKIDETGTAPNAGTTFDQPRADIDLAKSQAETAIGNAASIAAPAWSFSFAFPTGCAPYATGIKGVILNICQYQSTIHGLLSVIWAAATAFCLIGMVGQTIREA